MILVPGPSQEVATVLRIYRLFLQDGMPERVIASVLNREGIPNEVGGLWSRGTIHQILTNEKYVGHNVYNRTSFKLKLQHVQNPPEAWVRKEHAFEAIVPFDLFERVQAVIAARSVHLDDRQMLEALRSLLERHGALSGMLIDEEEGVPSSSAFRHRFGSLLRAYSLVGYSPNATTPIWRSTVPFGSGIPRWSDWWWMASPNTAGGLSHAGIPVCCG